MQRRLLKEIGAGVAGEREFGEDEDMNAVTLGLAHEVEDLSSIVLGVGDTQRGDGGRDAKETVLEHERLRKIG